AKDHGKEDQECVVFEEFIHILHPFLNFLIKIKNPKSLPPLESKKYDIIIFALTDNVKLSIE
ncbi:MAG: hypothetical protein PUE91_11025, partial [Clostridiales bacterium]|nr:hypothetical protein [Clostridiales bacterium]